MTTTILLGLFFYGVIAYAIGLCVEEKKTERGGLKIDVDEDQNTEEDSF